MQVLSAGRRRVVLMFSLRVVKKVVVMPQITHRLPQCAVTRMVVVLGVDLKIRLKLQLL